MFGAKDRQSLGIFSLNLSSARRYHSLQLPSYTETSSLPQTYAAKAKMQAVIPENIHFHLFYHNSGMEIILVTCSSNMNEVSRYAMNTD